MKTFPALLTVILLFFGMGLPPVTGQPQESEILAEWLIYRESENSLYDRFSRQAFRLLREREERLSALDSRNDWRRHRDQLRQDFREILEVDRPRTPLRARVTGVLEGEGYRVEKVVFESRPDFFVSGALFLPHESREPRPGILFCSGHSAQGFRSPVYQQMIVNLVQKGFVVFAFDPVGQGERIQYLDRLSGTSRVGGPTKEHSYPGAQALLFGRSIANYLVWDSIRALDYLASRPEVDAERLGVTGRSGGGTQTAYLAAVDERVLAAAPECYITTFERLISSIGPQDAEQNLPQFLLRGFDLPDFLLARIPRPTEIISTTRDFFSIQGAREAFAEVQGAYASWSAVRKIGLSEDDAPHQSTRANREAMYAFFQEALELPGSPSDREFPGWEEEELWVTQNGQVLSSLGGKTLHELVLADGKGFLDRLSDSRKNLAEHLPEVRRSLQEIWDRIPPFSVEGDVFAGGYEAEGYRLEERFLERKSAPPIPYLLWIPSNPRPAPAVLYLDAAGKDADRSRMQSLAESGSVVMAPDLSGLGELGPGHFRGDAFEFEQGVGRYNIWFLADLVGSSLAAMRGREIQILVEQLRFLSEVDPDRIVALARGDLGSALLMAAAISPEIQGVVLEGGLAEQKSVVSSEYYDPSLIHSTIPGSLQNFDLPDLAALLAPRPLIWIRPRDHNRTPLTEEKAAEVFKVVRRAYAEAGATDQLRILFNEIPGASVLP